MKERNHHIPEVNPNDGYERSDIDIRQTVWWSVIIILLIAVSLVFLWEYFISVREELYYDSVLKPESSKLREVRAHEEELLTSYAVVDSTTGAYRIPIERAIQLIVEESYQQQGSK
jgi:hypothetical protein